MRILFNILVIVLLPFISLSKISVDNNSPYNSPQYLVEEILLDQCVNSSNHQFHGDLMQLGYFDGSSVSLSNFNFSSGILLATPAPIAAKAPKSIVCTSNNIFFVFS